MSIQSAIEEEVRNHIFDTLNWGGLGIEPMYDLFIFDFIYNRDEVEVWVEIEHHSPFKEAVFTYRLGLTGGYLDLELFGTQFLYTTKQEHILSAKEDKVTLYLPYQDEGEEE